NNLGVLQAHRGAAEAATESLRKALRLQSAFSAARLNLGLLLYQLRRFQLSLEAYRQVLQTEPASAAAWNGIGLVLVELKRFPDARNAFVRAVEADPDHAGAHYNLSFTLSNLGDYDGALRATKRALELDPYYVSQKFARALHPQRADALLGEVKALLALGGARVEEARALAEQLLALTPDDVEALVAVAKGRAAAGDAAGALTALQQAQTRAPARADLHKLQGDVALKVGDKRGALAAYRAALELGVVLARLHRYGEAVQAWEKVTRLDPSGPFAQRARLHARTALDLQHIFTSDAA